MIAHQFVCSILPNALLRVTVVSLTSQRAEMGQGAVMGLSNSFTSLGRIVGPVWAGYTYDVDATYPFWSDVTAMLVGFVVSLIWAPRDSAKETDDQRSTHQDDLPIGQGRRV